MLKPIKRVSITKDAYSLLRKTRGFKQTDLPLTNGDWSIVLSPKSEARLNHLTMFRKLNRNTVSQAIFGLAYHQGLITIDEYKGTWKHVKTVKQQIAGI